RFLFLGSVGVDVYSISTDTGALVKLTDGNTKFWETGLSCTGSLLAIPSRLYIAPCLWIASYTDDIYAASIDATGTLTGFRRGLANNLHALGVEDKTIQAILRHSNVGLTMNVYVKSVSESQVSAMDALSEKLGTCNDLAMKPTGRIQ